MVIGELACGGRDREQGDGNRKKEKVHTCASVH